MSDDERFPELLSRVRLGDAEAAEELVRAYEPLVRREIRMGLRDTRMRRSLETVDVCQSVLASFFYRAAAGSFDLQSPQDLVRLLVRMAKNKVASAARHAYRQKRGIQQIVADGNEALEGAARNESTPSAQFAGRELWQEVLRRLQPEERQIVELRSHDLGWNDIAAQLGGTAQARRMQLARALERVGRELGLEDDDGTE